MKFYSHASTDVRVLFSVGVARDLASAVPQKSNGSKTDSIEEPEKLWKSKKKEIKTKSTQYLLFSQIYMKRIAFYLAQSC